MKIDRVVRFVPSRTSVTYIHKSAAVSVGAGIVGNETKRRFTYAHAILL